MQRLKLAAVEGSYLDNWACSCIHEVLTHTYKFIMCIHYLIASHL